MKVVGVFVAGLLTVAALYGIYVWHRGPSRPGGDDDPIIVAGGSMHIGSLYGFDQDSTLDPHGHHPQANHKHKTRYLNRVEVLYNNPKPAKPADPPEGPAYADVPVKRPVTIEIVYHCSDPSKCGTEPDDTVVFRTDPSGQNLSVKNSSGTNPIGDEVPNGSTPLKHQPDTRTVTKITVNSNPYLCDNGKCQVVLH